MGCSPQNFVIPASVTTIRAGAFYECSSQSKSIFKDFVFTYEGVALRYEIIAKNEVWVTRRWDMENYNLSGKLKIPSEVEKYNPKIEKYKIPN